MTLPRVHRCICILGLFLLAGCGGGGGGGITPPPVDNDQLLTTATIGSSGGSITANDLTITVPSGAFLSDHEMKIYKSADENPFGTAALSPLYRLEGLPITFNNSLLVSFPLSSKDAGTLVALGEKSFSESMAGMTTGFRVLPTTYNDSTAIAVLPAAPDVVGDGGQTTSVKIVNLAGYTSKSGAPGYGTLTTTENHFKISYPLGFAVQAANLGNYLENAFDVIHGWGFTYTARTNWPIKVTILKLGRDVFGYENASIWGDNYTYLEFNTLHIDETDEIKVTAGHEFFHLVQALYDNRNRVSKVSSPSDRYWLDEAMSCWSERAFIGDPTYTSGNVRMSREMMPFDRFHVGENGVNPDLHGYGMAAFIAFIRNETTNTSLASIYDYIYHHNNNPVAAVKSVFTEPYVIWHPRFLRELMQGDLYNDVSMANVLSHLDATWTINTPGSQQQIYDRQYNDGQARFFKIEPNASNFNPQTRLHLTLEDDADGLLNVYRYHGSTLELLGINNQEFDVEHLDTYATNGDKLLVMVTNSHLEGDYDAVNGMVLTAKVQEPSGFTRGYVWLSGKGEMTVHETSTAGLDTTYTISDYTVQMDGSLHMDPIAGSSIGETFTAVFDSMVVDENTHKIGSLHITVNNADNPTYLTGFDLVMHATRPYSGTPDNDKRYSMSGSGLTLNYGVSGVYDFLAQGSSANSFVDATTYTEVNTFGTVKTYTMDSFEADYIEVKLYK